VKSAVVVGEYLETYRCKSVFHLSYFLGIHDWEMPETI